MARLTAVLSNEVSGMEESAELPAWMGSLRGQIWIAPDIEAVEAEIAKEMENGPLFRGDKSKR